MEEPKPYTHAGIDAKGKPFQATTEAVKKVAAGARRLDIPTEASHLKNVSTNKDRAANRDS